MNEIVNKFLFAGDKFMPLIHLKQLGFACSACDPFTKKQIKNWEIYENWKYILFTGMSLIKLAFNMIWLMVN